MSEDLRMPRLSNAVDDMPKAHALLRLLDLTIGHTQDAVVPDDLSIALDRIESEAPHADIRSGLPATRCGGTQVNMALSQYERTPLIWGLWRENSQQT